MATVAQLIEDVSDVMAEKPETVNAYARALIDSGDLPKSRGRAIAHVEVEHIVKLFLAVILAPKVKDTAEAVRAYFHMRRPGVQPDFPASLQERAGEQLCDFVQVILCPEDGEEDLRKRVIKSTICFVLNWPEIEFDFGGGDLMRFKGSGSPLFWEGYHKRCVIVSGRAFLMLGLTKGRNYVDGEVSAHD